ncbi:MAG TPA: peptidoglycan-binding protein, partial [Devosia sp.]|nr:peptidoglycan-binding protein [Devosia sp.]
MRALSVGIALLPLLLSPVAAIAQETVLVAGVEATRVVIAPPQTELARIIKMGLGEAYFGATKGSRAYGEAQKLYFFYGSRHFEPLWLTQDSSGKVAFSASASKILDLFRKAEFEGFRPTDYLTPALDVTAAGSDPASLAALETAFSAAAVKYAQDAYGGRVAPTEVNPLWTVTPKRINAADLLVKLAASPAPDQVLLDLSPKGREFVALRSALARFYDGSVVDAAVSIPEGPLLKPGTKDERVTLLRQRLDVSEPDIPETAGAEATADITYDEPLVLAVQAFQESLGLTPDGVIGPATVAALNGGSATTREDIIANMERWRWEPADYGDFHVAVNIPEFRLVVMDRGQLHYTTRVVVGTPKNQTPVFSDEIEGPAGARVPFPQYFLAGMIAAGVVSTKFTSLATTISIERSEGLLKRLAGTPLPRASYFMGKIVLAAVTSAIQAAIILAIGAALYDVTLPTDPALWAV